MQWNNIFYEDKKEPLIGGRKSVVRLGTVQWQMRRVKDLDDLMQQVEFFVDAVAGYKADFALFPEFFNAPLMGHFNQENPAEAIRGLAQLHRGDPRAHAAAGGELQHQHHRRQHAGV